MGITPDCKIDRDFRLKMRRLWDTKSAAYAAKSIKGDCIIMKIRRVACLLAAVLLAVLCMIPAAAVSNIDDDYRIDGENNITNRVQEFDEGLKERIHEQTAPQDDMSGDMLFGDGYQGTRQPDGNNVTRSMEEGGTGVGTAWGVVIAIAIAVVAIVLIFMLVPKNRTPDDRSAD